MPPAQRLPALSFVSGSAWEARLRHHRRSVNPHPLPTPPRQPSHSNNGCLAPAPGCAAPRPGKDSSRIQSLLGSAQIAVHARCLQARPRLWTLLPCLPSAQSARRQNERLVRHPEPPPGGVLQLLASQERGPVGHALYPSGRLSHDADKQPLSPSPRLQAPRHSPPPPLGENRAPRSSHLASRSRPSYPPPPSVEDEAESLAKEFGACTVADYSDEEPQSRGDIDQYPIILEVHEHNPERRFVIVNDAPKASASGPGSKTAENSPSTSPAPLAGGSFKAQPSPRCESAPRKQHIRADSARPALESRRSRHDLPPIETDLRQRRPPEHHRSKSSASQAQPDFFSPRQSQFYGDQLLSPEILSGDAGGRDRPQRGLGQPPTSGRKSSGRQSYYEPGGRRRDEDYYYRKEPSASTVRRSESSAGTSKSSRRLSNDFARDHRHHREASSTRGSARESTRHQGRNEGDTARISPLPSRDHSRSGDGISTDARASYMQKKPLVIQNQRSVATAGLARNEDSPERPWPRSRTGAVPLPSPGRAAFAVATAATAAGTMTPRSSASLSMSDGERSRSNGGKAPLPYPDDDGFANLGLGISNGAHFTQDKTAHAPFPALYMPEPPQPPPTPERPIDFIRAVSPAETPKEVARPWQRPAFDLDKGGTQVNDNSYIGPYQYNFESKENAAPGDLPECPRTKPVVGMMDWLTLPRTEFNICPTCYGAAFSKSNFRTQFQPILRPTGDAIACSFGTSVWYRIAWLLTLRYGHSDLRLLHQVANVASSCRSETCPGSRKMTRNWLTIKDPYTKHPVPEFAVCYQCASTVEALLPNLMGAFVSLDPRSEPTRDTCALHFAAKRKQLMLYFDVLEMVSEKAYMDQKPPNLSGLAKDLQRLSIGRECLEDSPVQGGYWHIMQFLPEFTVCGVCFSEAVQPKIDDGNSLAQNFYMKPQRLPSATCQLYSSRMREVFSKACRRKDPGYLRDKVLERRDIEADIYENLLKLDKSKRGDAWAEEQMERLVREWRRWE